MLPLHIYHQPPGPIQLKPTKNVLIAFGGACIGTDGVVSLECETNKRKAMQDFHVSSQVEKSILDGNACVDRSKHRDWTNVYLQRSKEAFLEKYAEAFTRVENTVHKHGWESAVVICQREIPHSCAIQTPKGMMQKEQATSEKDPPKPVHLCPPG
ncbi:hypothetical protein XENOCAPTIV_008873 [Xenoophorus captivus]|uniref:Uncharacterized protein n=1 Tax=Xenoophorus captivus TaxID=1517983 RepID=A0ABV0RPL2_9TELE